METKRITISVDKNLHKSPKYLSIEEDKTLFELIITAIEKQYAQKFDKINLEKLNK